MIEREPLEGSRPSGMRWAVVGAAVLALHAGTAAATDDLFLLDRRICERLNLSDETRAWCDSIEGLSGRALYKATVLENLRRTNQPPIADLELERLLPGRVDVHALDAADEDGFPHIYYFRLEKDDTGEVIAGPLTTREPFASLTVNGELPQNARAVVIVEDDERAIDTAELSIPLATTTPCSNALFTCSVSSGQTTCSPTSGNKAFATGDLLDAAQRCDSSITESTRLVIAAGGAAGGSGAGDSTNDGGPGGHGGVALLATSLEALDDSFGTSATYCYGIGQAGSHGDTDGGAGGAATLLRTCDNVSQTATTGVLLIAGGGGGGGNAVNGGGGGSGAQGGVAIPTTSGSCPSSCASGSTTAGGGDSASGSGGSSGKGGAAGNCTNHVYGNDGIGGAGGYAEGWGTAYWTQGNALVGPNVGQGGESCPGDGSSGGGGFGGGGGTYDSGGGAGGGGSFAAQSVSAVTTIPGSSSGNGFLWFEFQPLPSLPVVTQVSPGTVAVGGTFEITGTGFTGVETVKVGGQILDGSSWTVVSATEITVTAPSVPSDYLGVPLAVEVDTAAGKSNSTVNVIIEPS